LLNKYFGIGFREGLNLDTRDFELLCITAEIVKAKERITYITDTRNATLADKNFIENIIRDLSSLQHKLVVGESEYVEMNWDILKGIEGKNV
jgi:hypothetical protein